METNINIKDTIKKEKEIQSTIEAIRKIEAIENCWWEEIN